MRDIRYQYHNRGVYQTEQDTAFSEDVWLKLVVEPHDFSLAIGGEVLRRTAYEGGVVEVSNEGEAVFYDNQNNVIGRADKGDSTYREVKLLWTPEALTVAFGQTETVDYYPNCDGEHDRYGSEWVSKRTVTLKADHTVDVE